MLKGCFASSDTGHFLYVQGTMNPNIYQEIHGSKCDEAWEMLDIQKGQPSNASHQNNLPVLFLQMKGLGILERQLSIPDLDQIENPSWDLKKADVARRK